MSIFFRTTADPKVTLDCQKKQSGTVKQSKLLNQRNTVVVYATALQNLVFRKLECPLATNDPRHLSVITSSAILEKISPQ